MNETFSIGFVMGMIETELNKKKQEVLIIYLHTHKHNFTSDSLNNPVATVVSSNFYWIYGRD
jgi:hypothetical protein